MLWGMSDAPGYENEDPDKPKKGNPAEGRNKMNKWKTWGQ